uniref:Uncharacterized protein n=1 Tax=Glossina brevipalpis TaxID=37001 RepID=A0A1A9WX84_9MUSC
MHFIILKTYREFGNLLALHRKDEILSLTEKFNRFQIVDRIICITPNCLTGLLFQVMLFASLCRANKKKSAVKLLLLQLMNHHISCREFKSNQTYSYITRKSAGISFLFAVSFVSSDIAFRASCDSKQLYTSYEILVTMRYYNAIII